MSLSFTFLMSKVQNIRLYFLPFTGKSTFGARLFRFNASYRSEWFALAQFYFDPLTYNRLLNNIVTTAAGEIVLCGARSFPGGGRCCQALSGKSPCGKKECAYL